MMSTEIHSKPRLFSPLFSPSLGRRGVRIVAGGVRTKACGSFRQTWSSSSRPICAASTNYQRTSRHTSCPCRCKPSRSFDTCWKSSSRHNAICCTVTWTSSPASVPPQQCAETHGVSGPADRPRYASHDVHRAQRNQLPEDLGRCATVPRGPRAPAGVLSCSGARRPVSQRSGSGIPAGSQ